MNSAIDYKRTKVVAVWLYLCAGFVFVMAVIGAITRLTESGLSMVEWRPLIGALPPLNEAEWHRVFDLYKQTSEYQKVHSWMTLADFKEIFFWEWFHRLWGRLIGLVYAVPFIFFIFTGRIPRQYRPSFWMFLFLGGLQGVIGWYMVQSGFVDRVDVSHYRLALHLGLAFIIFCLLLDMALKLSVPKSEAAITLAPLRRLLQYAFICVFLTMIWGGFVAGMNAGLIYNEFPMMGKYPWPSEGLDLTPLWINAVENHATVQFIHRVLALVSLGFVLHVSLRARFIPLEARPRKIFYMLGIMVVLQVALGITTLITQVHIVPAVLHQAGALTLLALLIAAYHETLPMSYSYQK